MRLAIVACAAAAAVLTIPVTSQAQTARQYFVARIADDPAPQVLSQADAAYYKQVFTAIDNQDWGTAEALLSDRQPGLLHPVAYAELYLAANSPRVDLSQIEQWLTTGTNLPQAEQMEKLGLARGASQADLPALPQEQQLYPQNTLPRRRRPASIDDGTMPANVAQAIHAAISNGEPDNARILLDGVDASLSSAARAEWRERVAWSYFIENRSAQALAMARTVSAGSGPWVAEGDWVAGLAAWRLDNCEVAGNSFRRSASETSNVELRTAALYWASRAALRCREPHLSDELLTAAARHYDTLYGMLSAEQIGLKLPDQQAHADLTRAEWQRISQIGNVRVAVGLAQIGQDQLASEVLLHQAKIGNPGNYASFSRLARDLNLPRTQLYMAYNAPAGGRADMAAYYPAPTWQPVDGWQVDPALAYAHILQESAFRKKAVSSADARGLMQITPITVQQHAARLNMSASSVNIFNPQVNLAFGQENLEMLQRDPVTHDKLPLIIAAYNAGLAPVRRWQREMKDRHDPLLFMEAIPYRETRGYVANVMRNYWMYERQADAGSPSRVALAENKWPAFPKVHTAPASGRVYLSARYTSTTDDN